MRRDRPWVEDPGFRHQAVQQLEGVRAEFVSPKGLERGVMHQCKGHLLFEPWLYGRRQREAALLDGVHDQLALRNIFQRSEEHTSELQSRLHLVCRLLLEKKKKHKTRCTNY